MKVLAKLTGAEGRRASLDVKLAILNTLGGLSKHDLDNTVIFPDVLKSLTDILTSEGLLRSLPFIFCGEKVETAIGNCFFLLTSVNEDIIECALTQLALWLQRPKCNLPEKAQTTIRVC